jgi:hypothetical protein
LGEGAIQPPTDAPVGGVEDVADGVARGEGHRDQVAQGVVGIAGGVAARDASAEFAVRRSPLVMQ